MTIFIILVLYAIFVAIQAGLYCRLSPIVFGTEVHVDLKPGLFIVWPVFWIFMLIVVFGNILMLLYSMAAGNDFKWFK